MSPTLHDLTGVRRTGTAAVVLAGVAGFVDAYVYLRVAHVFIANQSGNLIVGGMALGGAGVGGLLLPAVSVVAYIGGAAVVAAAFDRPGREGRARLFDTIVAVLVVLVTTAAALALAAEGDELGPRTPLVVAVVAATALAMGAQATAVRRTAGVAVLTTASTGAITSIGVAIGRSRGALDATSRAQVLRLVGVVVGYVGGAVAGAALCVHTGAGPELLALPCLALLAVLVAQRRPVTSPASGARRAGRARAPRRPPR